MGNPQLHLLSGGCIQQSHEAAAVTIMTIASIFDPFLICTHSVLADNSILLLALGCRRGGISMQVEGNMSGGKFNYTHTSMTMPLAMVDCFGLACQNITWAQ